MNEQQRKAKALDDAQFAFWAVIAESYPEVTTGDFPPECHFKWDADTREALTTWLKYNKGE